MTPIQLIQLAREAQVRGYAPYSQFKVGAAVANAAGQTAIGCNVENAALGSTICAEATALSQAVAQGIDEITDIAIVSDSQAAPCGNCRQLIIQLSPSCRVHLATPNSDEIRTVRIEDLLPDAFTSLD